MNPIKRWICRTPAISRTYLVLTYLPGRLRHHSDDGYTHHDLTRHTSRLIHMIMMLPIAEH